ncbi:MAG TPA: fumarylacetoacetate hydrolase family protein [Dehalococcoidia bacterium]|nr:fumarylacetoacetate hydrolase family protein [Dehalococcoidia bacterium]
MRVVVYGPERRVGILEGDSVVDAERAYAKLAHEVQDHPAPYRAATATAPADLEAFIQLGDRAIDAAHEAVEYLGKRRADQSGPRGEPVVFPLSEARLRAPLAHRGVKLCMAGANYADHLFDMMRAQDPSVTMAQVKERSRERGIGGFWKHPSFVADPEADIVYPAKTRYLDYEGEVAIVVGKAAKDASAGDLLDYIWGYTLQNDWSARDQRDNAVGTLSFAGMKNWDGSSSIGPCIVVGEIKDPQDIDFQTTVNGELRQNGNTSGMTFSFAEYLEYATRDVTFTAGDMIAAGTCKGTAMDSTPRIEGGGFENDKLFLNAGDVVEVSSPQIGALRNRVVAKKA